MSRGRAAGIREGRGLALAVAIALMGAALAPAGAGASAPAQDSSPTVWLCRPGLANNPCESDLTTTEIEPDGSQKVVRAARARRPPVDCFYVYPSVSAQPTLNANLNVDPELTAVAEAQASRFSQACRVFAPVYPQLTVVATGATGDQSAAARAAAYDGVLSAWRDYLAHDNKGRGVVFIGHSQGAGMLTQLLRTQIDPNPRLRHQSRGASSFARPRSQGTSSGWGAIYALHARVRPLRTTIDLQLRIHIILIGLIDVRVSQAKR